MTDINSAIEFGYRLAEADQILRRTDEAIGHRTYDLVGGNQRTIEGIEVAKRSLRRLLDSYEQETFEIRQMCEPYSTQPFVKGYLEALEKQDNALQKEILETPSNVLRDEVHI